MAIVIRPFQKQDESKLNSLARNAFLEYRTEFKDWPIVPKYILLKTQESSSVVSPWSLQERVITIILKAHVRTLQMLVVAPECRGKGIGHKLTQKCIDRATEIGASSIGL